MHQAFQYTKENMARQRFSFFSLKKIFQMVRFPVTAFLKSRRSFWHPYRAIITIMAKMAIWPFWRLWPNQGQPDKPWPIFFKNHVLGLFLLKFYKCHNLSNKTNCFFERKSWHSRFVASELFFLDHMRFWLIYNHKFFQCWIFFMSNLRMFRPLDKKWEQK